MELPALALPAHPASLGLVPAPPAVEQEEPRAATRRRAVPGVEAVDRGRGRGQQVVIAVRPLDRRIQPVRQQGEPDVAIRVAQVVDLEAPHLLLDIRLADQERRDGHQGPQFGRDAVLQLQPGQRRRAEQPGHQPVDQRHGQV